MVEKDKAIGIFDSGIGGLTVFRAVREALPNESIIYLGDTARVPYGTKSAETIIRYSIEDAGFLIKKGVKVIVVACNTSSAYAIPALAERNNIPIIGVIAPGARAAIAATKNNHIGVIGTESTIISSQYAKELRCLKRDIRVVSMACPLFVPLVEEGWIDNDVARLVASKYLSTMSAEGIDTLILGCTHYPLLKPVIQEALGDSITLVDSAEVLALELRAMFKDKGLLRGTGQHQIPMCRPEYHLYVTDIPARFEMTAHRFLEGDLPPVKTVVL